jgi:hypothetical protein
MGAAHSQQDLTTGQLTNYLMPFVVAVPMHTNATHSQGARVFHSAMPELSHVCCCCCCSLNMMSVPPPTSLSTTYGVC